MRTAAEIADHIPNCPAMGRQSEESGDGQWMVSVSLQVAEQAAAPVDGLIFPYGISLHLRPSHVAS